MSTIVYTLNLYLISKSQKGTCEKRFLIKIKTTEMHFRKDKYYVVKKVSVHDVM